MVASCSYPAVADGPDRVFSAWDNRRRAGYHGMGFKPEYAEQILGLFKRPHGRDVPGAGVGLANCRKILERHGGRIWAESEEGKGATFYFNLEAAASRASTQARAS